MTFSINIGLNTETTYRTFDSILNDLYDNTTKYIDPRFIRDAVFTTYVESIIKPTNNYIGVDTSNPSNRDAKLKHFYGKRQLDGTDIMTSSLLSSDTDIFFFNTKSDSDINNISTKLSFLSGPDISLYEKSPYIKSITLSGTTSQSYDFVNLSGDININSNTTVNISGITFSSSNIPTNNDLMFWDDISNSVIFDELSLVATSSIGSTGSPLYLESAEINLNNYSLEFTDTRPLPRTWNANLPITSINISESINTMLYKMLYTYLPPLVELELISPYDSGYIEIGMNILIPIKYTVTKRTNKIVYFNLSNLISSSPFCPISGNGFVTQTGILNGVLTPGTTTNNFTLTVIDDYTPPSSVSDSVSLVEVYPYFHGFGSSIDSFNLNSYTKIIRPKENTNINILGQGDYYFVYDSSYGLLNEILDGNDNDITSLSTNSLIILNSPQSYWGPKEFICYKITINESVPGQFYKFNF